MNEQFQEFWRVGKDARAVMALLLCGVCAVILAAGLWLIIGTAINVASCLFGCGSIV